MENEKVEEPRKASTAVWLAKRNVTKLSYTTACITAFFPHPSEGRCVAVVRGAG